MLASKFFRPELFMELPASFTSASLSKTGSSLFGVGFLESDVVGL